MNNTVNPSGSINAVLYGVVLFPAILIGLIWLGVAYALPRASRRQRCASVRREAAIAS